MKVVLCVFFLFLACRITSASQYISNHLSRTQSIDTKISFTFERSNDVWLESVGHRQRLLLHNAHSVAWRGDGLKIAFVSGDKIWTADPSDVSQSKVVCDLPPFRSTLDGIVNDVTIDWCRKKNFLAFSSVEAYNLSPVSPLVVHGPPEKLSLASIWTVFGGGHSPHECAPWISPLMRGWETIGAETVCSPAWGPADKTFYFIRGGSVWCADIGGFEISGEGDYGGPEIDYTWDPKEIIQADPDAGGTSEVDSVGYSAIRVSRDGTTLATQTTRLNGSGEWEIGIWRQSRTVWKEIDSFDGTSPSFTSDHNRVLYADPINNLIYVRDIRKKKSILLLYNATCPACNPNSTW